MSRSIFGPGFDVSTRTAIGASCAFAAVGGATTSAQDNKASLASFNIRISPLLSLAQAMADGRIPYQVYIQILDWQGLDRLGQAAECAQ
jgi:hypothetical protein